jgi:hypothetical protein
MFVSERARPPLVDEKWVGRLLTTQKSITQCKEIICKFFRSWRIKAAECRTGFPLQQFRLILISPDFLYEVFTRIFAVFTRIFVELFHRSCEIYLQISFFTAFFRLCEL